MTHPDPNADFVEQVLDAARDLAAGGGRVTDLAILEATDLHLPTIRAILDMENGKAVTLRRLAGQDAWEVDLREG